MALTTKPNIKTSQIDTTRPCSRSIDITPDDDNYLADADDNPLVTRGILVTVAGNLVVEFADDAEDDLRTIPVNANTIYPFAVVLVHTDTTATGIVGLL